MSIDYSDCSVCFSRRDRNHIAEVYHKRVDEVVSMFLEDRLSKEAGRDLEKGEYCLLFGSNTAANVEGFKWFLDNGI